MQHVIRTASGTVSIGEYVAAWKRVKQSPQGTMYKSSLCSWIPTSREQVLTEYLIGVHDRINAHLDYFGIGRKWDPTWQRDCLHLAREVNTPRLIVRWISQEFRKRLEHRLWQQECV